MFVNLSYRVSARTLAISLFYTGLFVSTVSIAVAKKYPLTASTTVPAANGEMNVGKDKNGNTNLELKVKHLAKPDRLSPPKATYTVWLKGPGGENTPAGQLIVNGKLEGSFKTVTPLHTFDVLITAEDDANSKTPAGSEVFHGSVQQ